MYKSGLVELEAVVAIARHGSFRAAASNLDMSPTAIGNAVASLEKRLGVRLFNRTTRNVALTSTVQLFARRRTPATDALGDRVSSSLWRDEGRNRH